MSKFTDALLQACRTTLGVRETAPNAGPGINAWLAGVGLPPGKSWCAAYVHGMHQTAADDCGVMNPCPKTGSAMHIWDLAPEACRQTLPAPGDVYVLDHGHGLGHVGIVETVRPDGAVATEISGNTNMEGSREGNAVVRHAGPPEVSHGGRLVGFLSLERLIPSGLLG